MQVDDAVKCLVFILQSDPIFQGAEVIADMELAGGLGSAQYTFLHIYADSAYRSA
jgi:hypothetical protein